MICTYIFCAYICIHTYKHRDLQTYKHTDMQACIQMYTTHAYTNRHTHTFIHITCTHAYIHLYNNYMHVMHIYRDLRSARSDADSPSKFFRQIALTAEFCQNF